jgi:hypothetical protein
MPYAQKHRRSKDADRKRLLRDRLYPKTQSGFTRWFRARVNEVVWRETPKWDRQLADRIEDESECDRTARRYYAGESKQPKRKFAYLIGWAFHDVGLKWCSGPVALMAAGHTEPFFRLLAALSGWNEPHARDVALRLAFASPTAAMPEQTVEEAYNISPDEALLSDGAKKGLDKLRRDFPADQTSDRQLAQKYLNMTTEHRTLIDLAWDRSLSTNVAASDDFQLALLIVTSGRCPDPVRLNAALNLIATSVRHGTSVSEKRVVEELLWISPVQDGFLDHLRIHKPEQYEEIVKRVSASHAAAETV